MSFTKASLKEIELPGNEFWGYKLVNNHEDQLHSRVNFYVWKPGLNLSNKGFHLLIGPPGKRIDCAVCQILRVKVRRACVIEVGYYEFRKEKYMSVIASECHVPQTEYDLAMNGRKSMIIEQEERKIGKVGGWYNFTRKELLVVAQARKIKWYSHMTKNELVKAIKEREDDKKRIQET